MVEKEEPSRRMGAMGGEEGEERERGRERVIQREVLKEVERRENVPPDTLTRERRGWERRQSRRRKTTTGRGMGLYRMTSSNVSAFFPFPSPPHASLLLAPPTVLH
jgi:hypothetical protein